MGVALDIFTAQISAAARLVAGHAELELAAHIKSQCQIEKDNSVELPIAQARWVNIQYVCQTNWQDEAEVINWLFNPRTQGITKETFPGFVNGNSCFVAFSPATQPLKQTAQAAAELNRNRHSHNLATTF